MRNTPVGGDVLITGATGFIGRHLVSALLEVGNSVKVLSRGRRDGDPGQLLRQANVKRVLADLSEGSSVNGACTGVDTIFHLAGYAHAEDADDESAAAAHRRITIDGTRLLLAEAVRARVKRFIFVSSVKAMGEEGDECLDESSPPHPETSYGRSKLEAEQMILEAGVINGFHACALRLPLVYGPGNKGNIPKMIQAIDRGYFPPIPETGNKRSMVHVADVVQALQLTAAEAAAGKVYIVTDGQPYSTRKIYLAIRRALGKGLPKWTLPRGMWWAAAHVGDAIARVTGRRMPLDSSVLSKLFGSAWYSNAAIRGELAFEPRHTLEGALPEMVEEYRKNVIRQLSD